MNVGTSLEARAETTEIVEPGVRTFDHPAILTEPATVFGPALRDHGLDATLTQRTSVSFGIVATIGVDDAGLLKWSTTNTANRRNCINERQQLRDVVDVRAGQDRDDGNAVGVYENVVLGTGARTIPGIRARQYDFIWTPPILRRFSHAVTDEVVAPLYPALDAASDAAGPDEIR